MIGFIGLSGRSVQPPAVFYIALNGDDANPGSLDRPFKTLDAAWQAIQQNAAEKATVFFRKGVYSIDKGIVLSEDGQKTHKDITFSNYNNEPVSITGGVTLHNTGFSKVTDPGILKRLPAEARNQVYVMDLRQEGISDFGTMKNNGIKAPLLPAALELFYNDLPLTIARWPNSGLLPIGTVMQRKTANDDPGFMMDNDRYTRWAESPDIWVAGQFAVGYASDNIPIDSIDHTNKTLYLKQTPSYSIYSSTDKSSGQIAGARKIRGYYFYNILEELDTPGEWWLDRQTGKLYLWPPTPIGNATIGVSVLEQPVWKLARCTNISIRNIDFSCTRGIGLQIERSQRISIENCTFSNTGLQGIVSNTCADVHITGCTFAHNGSGGIFINCGDRKTLTPSNCSIQNCEFYDFSRLYKTYMPAVNLGGVGIAVLNCYIHDVPDQAIVFSGNNHLIANNLIRNVCTGYSDMGAIYTGRDPSSTGDTIRNNFFDHVLDSIGVVAAVYMDDGSGGMIVDQNIFYACGSGNFGAVHINGGGDNRFNNNLFVECPKAFSNQPWTDEQWKSLYIRNQQYVNRLTKNVDIRSAAYVSQYPWLQDFFDTTNIRPRKNYINNTICYKVKTFYAGNSYVITDSLLTDNNPGFADIQKGNFKMVSVPQEVKDWPGWKPVEFDKIGKGVSVNPR